VRLAHCELPVLTIELVPVTARRVDGNTFSPPSPSPPPPLSNTIENASRYQICIANPSTCTGLNLCCGSRIGTIPTEIGLLTALDYLTFGGNLWLTGSIPTEVGKLTLLGEFWVNYNELDSSIPTELGLLTSLKVLKARGNDFTSSIPTELGLLTSLTSLHLDDNSLTGTVPAELIALAVADMYVPRPSCIESGAS
jgi:Leucine-rich repeat (LRR) protein